MAPARRGGRGGEKGGGWVIVFHIDMLSGIVG